MKKFLCQTCDKQLKYSNGDFLFSFNLNCDNGHEEKNIDLGDLLIKRKQNNVEIFKCKNHKRKNIIHCFDCKEDICFNCYKESHKLHKIEYIEKLDFTKSQKASFKRVLVSSRKVIDRFLSDLLDFQNKLKTYISIIRNELMNYHILRTELVDDISQNNISYIDINNMKMILNDDYLKKIMNLANNFTLCKTFTKRYDILKNIFEELLKKGNYIEEQSVKEKYNKYNEMKTWLWPINNNYFIKTNDLNKHKFEIIKITSNKKFEFETIFDYTNYNFEPQNIIIKEKNNIEEELSFYITNLINIGNHFYKYELYEMKIQDLYKYNEKKTKFDIKKIKEFDRPINLLVLSENKIIVQRGKDLLLYNNSFTQEKKICNNELDNRFLNMLKINENTFVYPNKDIFAINIDNEFIDKFRIRNSGSLLIYYFKNKKILISRDDNYFYLINFNVAIPEVFQKVETDSKLANYNNDYNYSFYNYFQHKINNFIEILNCSNEDSIYISYSERKFENYLEHDITYFVQYSIIDNELKEISRIELRNEIIINE